MEVKGKQEEICTTDTDIGDYQTKLILPFYMIFLEKGNAGDFICLEFCEAQIPY